MYCFFGIVWSISLFLSQERSIQNWIALKLHYKWNYIIIFCRTERFMQLAFLVRMYVFVCMICMYGFYWNFGFSGRYNLYCQIMFISNNSLGHRCISLQKGVSIALYPTIWIFISTLCCHMEWNNMNMIGTYLWSDRNSDHRDWSLYILNRQPHHGTGSSCQNKLGYSEEFMLHASDQKSDFSPIRTG